MIIDMETVTLSPKFQVVIPQSVREALQLKPGEKLRVIRYGNRVEFIPVRSAREMRGSLRESIQTSNERTTGFDQSKRRGLIRMVGVSRKH